MRVIENGENFDYLKDAIVTDNCTAEVINNQLVLGISKERFLNTVKTYSIGVALRNVETCNITGRLYTYFVRLFFRGKIKLYHTIPGAILSLNASTVKKGEDESEVIYDGIKATPYEMPSKQLHLKFLTFSSENETHDADIQTSGITITGGSGVSGIINVDSGTITTFTLRVTTTETDEAFLRIFKKKKDNSIGDKVFEQKLNGSKLTSFSFTLPEGSYYLSQSADTSYSYIAEASNNGGKTTIKLNPQDGNPSFCAKIYKYDETSKTLSLVTSTSFGNGERPLTTVKQDYMDGNNEIYYLTIFSTQEAKLLGMSCNVSLYVDPPICFKYNGQPPDSFSITDSNITQSLETFSASINSKENN